MNIVKRKTILLNWVSMKTSFIIRFVYSIQKSIISMNWFLLILLSLFPIKCNHITVILCSLCNEEKVNDTVLTPYVFHRLCTQLQSLVDVWFLNLSVLKIPFYISTSSSVSSDAVLEVPLFSPIHSSIVKYYMYILWLVSIEPSIILLIAPS